MLIEIEGIDGVGKTTQCQILYDWLSSQGISTESVSEPGGTNFGTEIKKVLGSKISRDRKSEAFAFLACKTQLYVEIIIPAIAQEKIVIADRGQGSFLSYNMAKGASYEELSKLLELATLGIKPTLTVYLDAPVDIARQRNWSHNKKSRFDEAGQVFFERQRVIYLNLANIMPAWIIIDATQSIKHITIAIINHLTKLLPIIHH